MTGSGSPLGSQLCCQIVSQRLKVFMFGQFKVINPVVNGGIGKQLPAVIWQTLPGRHKAPEWRQ